MYLHISDQWGSWEQSFCVMMLNPPPAVVIWERGTAGRAQHVLLSSCYPCFTPKVAVDTQSLDLGVELGKETLGAAAAGLKRHFWHPTLSPVASCL